MSFSINRHSIVSNQIEKLKNLNSLEPPKIVERIVSFIEFLKKSQDEVQEIVPELSHEEREVLGSARPFIQKYYVADIERILGWIEGDLDLWKWICQARVNVERFNILFRMVVQPLQTHEVDRRIGLRQEEYPEYAFSLEEPSGGKAITLVGDELP